jgi:hypothetical protein
MTINQSVNESIFHSINHSITQSLNQSLKSTTETSNWERISNTAKLGVQKTAKIKNQICADAHQYLLRYTAFKWCEKN